MEYYLLLLLLLHYKEERDPIQYYLIALTDMIYPIRWGWKREKTPYPNPSLVVLIRMLSTISFSLDFMVVLQYLLVNRIRELFAPPKYMGYVLSMITLFPDNLVPGCNRLLLSILPYYLCFIHMHDYDECCSKVLSVRVLTYTTEYAFSWWM